MAKIDKIQEVALTELKPYKNNAKLHSQEQVEMIAHSIEQFGFIVPILLDQEKNIIAGHGRAMAAELLEMETVPCLFIEGLTETEYRAFVIADNKLTELGGWDRDILSEELEALREEDFDISLTGFDIDNIIIDEDEEPDMTEDEAEEIAEAHEPRVKRGEIWILGRHRLMCGDSTNPDDVKNLLGGVQADLLITDPPYNVDYGSKAEAINKYGYDFSDRHIENDCMPTEQFKEFLYAAFSNASEHLKEGAAFYVWHASTTVVEFIEALKEADLTVRQQLIWVKNTIVLGRQDYQWRHEPCLYGWKDGAGHYFIDMRSLSTVDEKRLENLTLDEAIDELKKLYDITTTNYENEPAKSEEHPTMKPVALIKKHIRNSSREGDTVIDLFGGSGTTLIACEEMNRKCYMMEFDPHYAEVIIDRWEKLTNEKAELLK